MAKSVELVSVVACPHAGVQLVQVDASTIPNEIEAGDLLRIDFDQRSFGRDGLYVLRVGKWTGVRRISDIVGEGPRVKQHDAWEALPTGVEILGYVGMVYTPRRAAALREVLHG
ncbi:hypothetical protein A3K87_04265 [Variovorax paradoxus]|uniref:Uncharacterized protein n=1 Tax=Variovorax paradoxus TaxID=34073 RepID=A0AA91I879_VARPD|nr:hypothetical protein [Variovorax paradoxus]OAK55020.1 hypothetical protein A3K87_04265 [Variovorax paradoxus]